jgi:hypothetical protein
MIRQEILLDVGTHMEFEAAVPNRMIPKGGLGDGTLYPARLDPHKGDTRPAYRATRFAVRDSSGVFVGWMAASDVGIDNVHDWVKGQRP